MSSVKSLPLEWNKVLVTPEQIALRVKELARQISADYSGKTLHMLCVLENGFIFAADLARALDLPVVCQFVRPEVRDESAGRPMREIYYGPELQVKGQHVLLVEAILQSGQTSEFLIRSMLMRGAASVKLCCLLDKQPARKIALQPDYFGFLLDDTFVAGYGLGAPEVGRNLPYIVSLPKTLSAAVPAE